MKKIIHVNAHNIRYNTKNKQIKPVLTCKTYKDNTYAHEVEIKHEGVVVGKFIYRPDKPLSCGAKVWFETECDIEVVR